MQEYNSISLGLTANALETLIIGASAVTKARLGPGDSRI